MTEMMLLKTGSSNSRNRFKSFFSHLYRGSCYCQFFLLPTDAQENCFIGVLKFTLKQLEHVSLLPPSSGSIIYELAVTLESSYSALPDDGDHTETCWSCFNVNFNNPF